VKREPVSASDLTVALQCGGSDGYSGVSANPALGAASDLLVRHGGTVILFGNAGDLWRRTSVDAPRGQPRVGEKLVALMRWWEEYTEREGAEMTPIQAPETRPAGSPRSWKNRLAPWPRPAAPIWWTW